MPESTPEHAPEHTLGASAVAPPGLDLERLRARLERALPGTVAGPLRAELIEGGRSNLSYRLTDGVTDWVLRRPPLGHVLATAHAWGASTG